jgi:hypothetical protein
MSSKKSGDVTAAAVGPFDPTGPAAAPSDSDLTGRAKELYDRSDDLETQLNVATENGLFIHQSVVKHEEILDGVKRVFKISLKQPVSAEDYSDAIGLLDEAQNRLDISLQAVGLRRRLIYVYGAPAVAYLLAVLLFMIWISFWPLPLFSGPLIFISIPLQIMFAGVVGGVLRGVKAVWSQVDKLQYRKFWGTWFVLCPVMGLLLGGAIYLAFVTGILVSTSSAPITNTTLAVLLAILAGYNWEWAEGVLAKIPDIFSVGSTQNKDKPLPSP